MSFLRTRAGVGRGFLRLILPLALAGAAGCVSFAPALMPGSGSPAALQFRDGPPARVTGGFGEDSCHACHFDGGLNERPGSLSLSGFPERYTPGETYELGLIVARPELSAAGFQLAVRHADDRSQAGLLEIPPQDARRAQVLEERGVQFAQQRLPETEGAGAHTAQWTILWTAPADGKPVVAHAAALAGDGDESQMGDFVYTLERAAEAADAVSGFAK